MIGYVILGIFTVAVIGPNATKNVLHGLHDYSDGASVGFRKDAEKYKKEQYNK